MLIKMPNISRFMSNTAVALISTTVMLQLTACSSSLPPTASVAPTTSSTSTTAIQTTTVQQTASPDAKNPADTQQLLVKQAKSIQQLLAQKEFSKLADFIHPSKGVQFSMYAYIQPSSDKTFIRQDFLTYLQKDKIKFTWGEMDGTGDLLITPLPDYLSDWITAEELNEANITINQSQGFGNSRNNLRAIYPNHDVVEMYYAGSEKYMQMDWRVMRLVFENHMGKPYLIAIITDEWTI